MDLEGVSENISVNDLSNTTVPDSISELDAGLESTYYNQVFSILYILVEYLYSGSEFTSKMFLISILLFIFRHNISNEAINDLLHLFRKTLPYPNTVPSSLWKFKKKVREYCGISPDYHYYCSSCYSNLPGESSSCSVCSTDDTTTSLYFTTLSLKSQLKKLT